MEEIAIYNLMIQYPALREFIISCVKERDLDKLFDFLHAIELEDEFMYKQACQQYDRKVDIDYKKIARTIVKQQTENLVKTMQTGQCADLHWKLENAIVDALKYVAKNTEKQVKMELFNIIQDFDSNDGPTNN